MTQSEEIEKFATLSAMLSVSRSTKCDQTAYPLMYEIFVEEKFDAAHCLRGYSGNCERLHGHTYRVRATLQTNELDKIGMAVDFRAIRADLRAVVKDLDHTYLNDLPEFSQINPSAENLARFIYGKLAEKYAGLLQKVTVWETEGSAATYREDRTE